MEELEQNLTLILQEKEEKIIPENIKEGVTIFGVDGTLTSEELDTSDGTATSDDIKLDKVAYVQGERIVGTHECIDTSDANATKDKILSGYNAYVNDEKVEGTMINNDRLYYTPKSTDQTIPQGFTLGGTVWGDSNLVSENIKSGITIFNIEGSYEGVNTDDATATAADILIGKIAYVKGEKIEGTLEKTYYDPNGISYLHSDSSPITIEEFGPTNNQYWIGFESNVSKNISLAADSLIQLSIPQTTLAEHLGLTPEILAEGSYILGIEGTCGKVDLSDATAEPIDLAYGKTAYTEEGLITGTLPQLSGQIGTKLRQISHNSTQTYISLYPVKGYSDGTTSTVTLFIPTASRWSIDANDEHKRFINELFTELGITADIIKAGKYLYGTWGTFSADGDATSADIVSGKIAYVNGEKIIGTLETDLPLDKIYTTATSTAITIEDPENLTVSGVVGTSGIVDEETPIEIKATKDQVASAIGLAPDIIKVGTNILGIEGTYGADESTKNAILQVPEGVTSTTILSSLVSIESLDTSTLTNTANLFREAFQLKSVPELNLGNSTNTSFMFYKCSNLVSVPQLNLATSTSLNSMFYNCTNLTRINIIAPTSTGTSYENMFNGCVNLVEMPVINYATLFVPGTYSSCRNVIGMYDNCRSLTTASLDRRYISSRYGCNFSYMFRNCVNLVNFVGMTKRSSYYDFRQICTSMFENCTNLQTVSDINFVGVSLTNTFRDCHNLTTLTNVSFLAGTDGVMQDNTFRNCYNLLNPPTYSAWDFETTSNSIFENCYNITFNSPISIGYGGNNRQGTITNTFRDCHSITNLTLQAVQTQSNSVQYMSNIFTNCYNLVNVTIQNFGNYIVLSESFTGCNNLKCVNFINTKLNHSNLFRNSHVTSVVNSVLNNGVIEVDRKVWDNSYRDCYYLVECGNINLDTYQVDNCFTDCYNLNNLSGTSFYNAKVVTNMFANCTNLIEMKAFTNWTTSNQINISNMFVGCTNLSYVQSLNMTTHNGNGTPICPFGHYNSIINTISPVLSNLVYFEGFKGIGASYSITTANYVNAAVDIVGAPNLSYESILNITTNLANLYTTYNITEGGELSYPQLIHMEINQYNKLSETDITNIQSKGWNIQVHTIPTV